MKNLLINYLSGDKIFESLDLEIYFNSLKKINNADKLVVVNNVSDKNIKLLENKYDKQLKDLIKAFNNGLITFDEMCELNMNVIDKANIDKLRNK